MGPPPAPTQARRPPIWLLVALTGAGPFTMQILVPTLPALGTAFAAPPVSVQLVLTLYLAGVAVAPLFYGPLSDRFGRRPVLLAALCLFVVASLAAAAVTSLTGLIWARVAQAVGACSGMVLVRAIIRDTHGRERSASLIGYVTMGMTVAPMVAPMVGALLEQHAGWRAVLLACLAVAAPLLVATWRSLPETLPVPQKLPGLAGLLRLYGALLAQPGFRAYAAVSTCSTGIFFAFISGAPYVVVNGLGLPATAYAAAFMSISVSYALGNFLAGRLSVGVGLLPMLRAGVGLTSVAAVGMLAAVMLLPAHIATLFGPMAVVALGNGISQPNALAGAVSVRPELAGTASGLAGFAAMAFGAVLSYVVAVIETGTGVATAAVMCACGIAAQAALRLVPKGG